MKKFKLFALAVMAMLSTNAFAATPVTWANTTLRYSYDADAVAAGATIIGFVNELPAASQVTLEIPATVLQSDNKTPINVVAIKANAFEGNTNIQTLTIADANVATINDEAFKGCTALESVTFGKAVTTIGTTAGKGAFSGCTKLATVTFNAANAAQTIAAGAFANTAITSLDLTPTKVAALNPLFQTVGAQVTEIKLPATLTSIEANAFSGLTKLTSIDFTECNAVAGIAIEANAFKDAMKITSFTVPGVVTALKDDAFAGSYITALTIDATDDTHPLAVGEGTNGIGATKITSLTVNGVNLTIAKGAFKDAAALATVTFSGGDLATGAVAQGAFAKTGTQKIAVSYSPTDDASTTAFAKDAFSSGATDATYVTFTTTETYGGLIATALGWSTAGDTYGVKLAYEVTPLTIDVYKNGGSFAYGGFTVPAAYANGIKIAKNQGTDGKTNVMVYGAYFDNIDKIGKKSAVMMDQLHLIGGFYYLPAGTKFIVKSSSEDKVVFTEMTAAEKAANDSRHMNAIGGADQNEIQVYAGPADCYANSLFVANKTIYFLRDLAGGKEFGWKQREDDSVIKAGQLYLIFDGKASAARLDVVWLDGSEEDATAIKAVKTAAEKGAIYNLAGQKVNAAYKGVVIKDGKKYIQK